MQTSSSHNLTSSRIKFISLGFDPARNRLLLPRPGCYYFRGRITRGPLELNWVTSNPYLILVGAARFRDREGREKGGGCVAASSGPDCSSLSGLLRARSQRTK